MTRRLMMIVRPLLAGLAVAIILIPIPIPGQVPSGSSVRVGQVSLEVVGGLSGQERRLVVVKDGKELGSLAVPARVPSSSIAEGLTGALVHPNGHDLAVGFKGANRSYVRGQTSGFVVVFLRQASGAYLAVDVSQVEGANIGMSGPFRAYFDLETVPLEWLPRDDDSVQIRLQTRARDQSGQRYRPTEPLVITRDGRPLWR